ncbi:MAG: ribosomal RNA small subunit methyltransferase A [Oscillospiraceae bacterium]|nr:ribosomal RNA small subunit methyltransferase A [Oscillospiraceae bacterium]
MDLFDINVIKPLLANHGFHFSKSKGQNFLTARWVPERIAAESGIDDGCGVLEVGPGIGVLTSELGKAAAKVCAVELDKMLIPVLAETLGGRDNIKVIEGDILKTDLHELVAREFEGLSPRVCANLPYNITTPVLSALIDSGCFEGITVMIQREVAHRICSKPGTADYGAFTVYANYHTEPKILFDVPPSCFIPQPKVYSSVITLTPRKDKYPVKSEDMFFKTVKASFLQRRKTLVNGLTSFFGNLSKDDIISAILECGFDEKVRGETLSIPEFAALADKLFELTN